MNCDELNRLNRTKLEYTLLKIEKPNTFWIRLEQNLYLRQSISDIIEEARRILNSVNFEIIGVDIGNSIFGGTEINVEIESTAKYTELPIRCPNCFNEGSVKLELELTELVYVTENLVKTGDVDSPSLPVDWYTQSTGTCNKCGFKAALVEFPVSKANPA